VVCQAFHATPPRKTSSFSPLCRSFYLPFPAVPDTSISVFAQWSLCSLSRATASSFSSLIYLSPPSSVFASRSDPPPVDLFTLSREVFSPTVLCLTSGFFFFVFLQVPFSFFSSDFSPISSVLSCRDFLSQRDSDVPFSPAFFALSFHARRTGCPSPLVGSICFHDKRVDLFKARPVPKTVLGGAFSPSPNRRCFGERWLDASGFPFSLFSKYGKEPYSFSRPCRLTTLDGPPPPPTKKGFHFLL